jgi:hypothetical protein
VVLGGWDWKGAVEKKLVRSVVVFRSERLSCQVLTMLGAVLVGLCLCDEILLDFQIKTNEVHTRVELELRCYQDQV